LTKIPGIVYLFQVIKMRTKLFISVAVALVLILASLFVWNGQKTGRVIDSYKKVPVYDNGLFFWRSHGKNYAADGYYLGQKWQCVEFVKRFYYDAKGHKMPDVMGHAKSFFDESLPDNTLNSRRGLLQFHNGSTHKPQADDLLVFTDTRYGHVGIVTRVDENSLEIIQQNILSGSRQKFTMTVTNGHYFITAPRQPAGWLRK